MNYKDYEIPQDLVFNTRDIIDLHGLKCSSVLNPADFTDIFNSPTKIKKIKIDLSFSVLSKEILAQGKLSGVAQVECSRCLKQFEREFEEEFTQLYSLKEEIIDIMSITKQTLALLDNIQNLCSSSCKGLCSICGCNKNEIECDCKPPSTSPFACLKDKFSKK
ncbi:MAG: DUF177 domain-containing protein [Elusimicrobiota bacterium]|jgi:uncharacterized protein|nr:DUF177 domain-containing protein [Elusimicrobiota bacterium]